MRPARFASPASRLHRGLLAAGLLAASVSASALNSFTFDPGIAGLAGTAFTADNLLISDYATVTQTSATTFSETGFLAITGAQLNNSTLSVAGLNSSWGMYIEFTATGTTTGGDPLASVVSGSFTSLSYTLYGYNGTATFGFSGTTPTTTATSPVVLAMGSLIGGGVASIPGGGAFSPTASATVSVGNVSAAFTAPAGFYSQAFTSFTNTPSQVQLFAGGFMVQQGGGTINFAAPVPEPMTSALLLGGLGVIGFVARRRIGMR
jgi:hypothetical protein